MHKCLGIKNLNCSPYYGRDLAWNWLLLVYCTETLLGIRTLVMWKGCVEGWRNLLWNLGILFYFLFICIDEFLHLLSNVCIIFFFCIFILYNYVPLLSNAPITLWWWSQMNFLINLFYYYRIWTVGDEFF